MVKPFLGRLSFLGVPDTVNTTANVWNCSHTLFESMLVHILQQPTEQPSQMAQAKQLSHQPDEKSGFQLFDSKNYINFKCDPLWIPNKNSEPSDKMFSYPFCIHQTNLQGCNHISTLLIVVDISPFSADSSHQAPALSASHARSTGSRGPKCHRFLEPSKMRRRPSLYLGNFEVGIPLSKSPH